jgi:formylglycine-generating enzyme required for sulfatase activity
MIMANHDKIQAFIQQGTELLQKRTEPAKKLLENIALVEKEVQELQEQKASLQKRKAFLQELLVPFPEIYAELRQILVALPIPGHWQPLGLNEQGFWHYQDTKTQVVLIHIPKGRFWLGASPEDKNAGSLEKPSQQVFLDEYFIARTPLTCGQYKIFWESTTEKDKKALFSHVYEILGADEWLEYSKKLDWAGTKGWNFFYCTKKEEDYNNKAFFQNREEMISLLLQGPQWWGRPKKALLTWEDYDDSHPVVGVSWIEAYAYCLWAGYCLPSEAQWEKAGKGGLFLDGDESGKISNDNPRRIYPWGDRWDKNKCNNYTLRISKTTSVNDSRFDQGVSPYGCRDIAGNVWEWCQDLYDIHFYDTIQKEQDRRKQGKEPEIHNPICLKKQGLCVCRGGSCYSVSQLARVSRRDRRHPADRDGNVGLRVCAGVFLDSVL